MEKLDRLGWAGGVAFVSHGVRLGIRLTDATVLPRLVEHLPPGWKPMSSPMVDGLYSLVVGGLSPRSGVRRYHLLYAGAGRLARTMDLDEALDSLETDLHYQVAIAAPRRLFVHAGVVGWQGRAIVIPGRSMSGKTSLVEALVRAGATYYSDEFAVFDARGRVHPYARPLAIRGAGGERQTRIAVEALGGRAGTRPLPVGLIAITHYQPGAHWRPRRLTAGQAALELLNHTVLARVRPEFALKTLRQVVPGVATTKGKRGEARDVAARLLDELERLERQRAG